ncbi:putative allantoicase [Kineosporia sp. NBRC 101677]|uniref:allantoicase n=1 Tax=Kineosporia sp. NBRC 101677 TaxID=3032197 RepID=UPI0024A36233|nr:allantoicase [Kineosporia sp. NBRC 101677]GLY14323.1 putative allantoicase [Kineosporia sp. NBRC 101677]
MAEKQWLPDLASSDVGGRVVYANDQLFADRRNLIRPEPSAHQTHTFGPDGKIYDGWETRRRRDQGHDHAIVRLGMPGVVRSVVIDTAHFKGNYPPFASIEAAAGEDYPVAQELPESAWTTILPKVALKGDTANVFEVSSDHRWTHVRLSIYPDGGVARLRVHGWPVADPRHLTGTIDLAAQGNGGAVVDSSDDFYSSASKLILPGNPPTTQGGWENARRRAGGNDYVLFSLAGLGRVRRAVIDTSHFLGNSPGEVQLTGLDGRDADPERPVSDHGPWLELLPRRPLRPDSVHRFRPAREAVTLVRMDVYPDGGMSRVRLLGELEPEALDQLTLRYLAALPGGHLEELLLAVPSLGSAEADELRSSRATITAVPPALRSYLLD